MADVCLINPNIGNKSSVEKFKSILNYSLFNGFYNMNANIEIYAIPIINYPF